MLMSLFGHGVVGNVMAGWTRLKEIRAIHKEYRLFYRICGSAVLVGVGILLGAALFSDQNGYEMNLFTEMIGVAVSIGITVLVIDRMYERRNTERLKNNLKR